MLLSIIHQLKQENRVGIFISTTKGIGAHVDCVERLFSSLSVLMFSPIPSVSFEDF